MINEQSTPYGFLSAGGQMGERIRNTDWSKTPLGDVSCWSSSFISALGICLNSNFPIAIYWGEELTLLYNGAWLKSTLRNLPAPAPLFAGRQFAAKVF